ncbi:MAG: NADAR family protein [Bacteroidetes bacterium]|nr:NADAR family protein [Bacteroidota bacterium]
MKYDIPWIQAQRQLGTVEYLFFWGHRPENNGSIGKGCLSQWWESPFALDGVAYASAEHWMMACKARLFGDDVMLKQILHAKTPADAKKLGRKVHNFDSRRWDAQKYAFVLQGNLLKFGQHANLRAFLLGTGDKILVEASPYDNIWGIGLSVDAPGVQDPANWQGENLLGFALMETRDLLRQEAES